MSRLDDELKAAFRRQEPSEDFTARLMAQLNAQPKPVVKPSFWQTLVGFFQPNALRWSVAAAALLLIAVLGFVQYQRQSQRTQSAGDAVQAQTPPPAMANPPAPEVTHDPVAAGDKDPNHQDENKIGPEKNAPHEPKRLTPRPQPVTHHLAISHRPSTGGNTTVAHETGAKSEGEIAKEQLMKALYIASTLINEAKDVAIGGKD